MGAGIVPTPGAARTRARVRADDREPAPRRVVPGALSPTLSGARRAAPQDGRPDAAPRASLPTRPEALPPLGSAFDEALDAGLAELALRGTRADSAPARHSYEAHARLLTAWGAAMSLTAIREPGAIARRHVCDSLSAVPRLESLIAEGGALLDLGSGAGYPGLPIAAALALGRVALVESVGKKARFLDVAGAAVAAILAEELAASAPRIETLADRAEDLAQEEGHRAMWDVVTARAVGSLAEVVELGLPLLREGGWLLAWKREGEADRLTVELREAGQILRLCGGGRPDIVAVPGASLAGHRLIFVPKERATPPGFPRPASARRRRA